MTTLPVYLHLPKTGGTSVRSALADAFDGSAFLDVLLAIMGTPDGLFANIDDQRDDIVKLVKTAQAHETEIAYLSAGHVIGIEKYLQKREVRYHTVVREPVDRCLSFINYAYINFPDTYERMARCDFDPQRCAREMQIPDLLNDQTRRISGTNVLDIQQATLEKAKVILQQQFDYIGVFDNLTEAVQAILRSFGVDSPARKAPHVNEAPKEWAASAGLREMIEDANQADVALYNWIRHEFHGVQFDSSMQPLSPNPASGSYANSSSEESSF